MRIERHTEPASIHESLPHGRIGLQRLKRKCESKPVHVSQCIGFPRLDDNSFGERRYQLQRQPRHMVELFGPAGGRALHAAGARRCLVRND
jgi:hypothetical protein